MNLRLILIILLPFLLTSAGLAVFYFWRKHYKKLSLLMGIVALALGYLFLHITDISWDRLIPRSHISYGPQEENRDLNKTSQRTDVDYGLLESNGKPQTADSNKITSRKAKLVKKPVVDLVVYGPMWSEEDSLKTLPPSNVEYGPPEFYNGKDSTDKMCDEVYGPPPVFPDSVKPDSPKPRKRR